MPHIPHFEGEDRGTMHYPIGAKPQLQGPIPDVWLDGWRQGWLLGWQAGLEQGRQQGWQEACTQPSGTGAASRDLLSDELIMHILSLTGSQSCTALSKGTKMKLWTPGGVATCLIEQHGVQQALFQAAWGGQLAVCELLLLQHPAKADHNNSAALQAAAGKGHFLICRLLMQQQQHPARASHHKSAALQAAAGNGHLRVCRLLLRYKQHCAKAGHGWSAALQAAALGGHLGVCRLLLRQKQLPAMADDMNSIPLTLAAVNGHYNVCRLLLEYPTDPAKADDNGSLALQVAAAGGYVEICQLLLQQQHDPADAGGWNASSEPLHMALQSATRVGGPRLKKYMRDWVRDLHSRVQAARVAPPQAYTKTTSQQAKLTVCKLLLQHQPEPARADSYNSAALQLAAEGGLLEMCQVLLEARYPARADDCNSAPLVAAAHRGHLEVCELLLQHATHDVSNMHMAHELARSYGHHKVCELLAQHMGHRGW